MSRALPSSILVLALLAASTATADPTSESGVTGRVVDRTCPGPCQVGADPRPFEGEADVSIRERGSGKPVVVVPVEKSRYRAELEPGRYRLTVIPYPDVPSVCWMGSSRHVHVEPGALAHRRLHVENVCVQ